MVFQDAGASLTPWLTVGELIGERLRDEGLGPGGAGSERVRRPCGLVGLPAEVAGAKPTQLSGGQRQRVALARATVVPPEVLLCDEPTSALDVSLAATVLNLIGRLRRELGMAVLFVTHDLAAARMVADRIAVMYLGRIVELGPAEEAVPIALAPVHQVAARRGPGTRSTPDGAPGRTGQPHRSPLGLRVPSPMPVGHPLVLERARTAARGLDRWSSGRLPRVARWRGDACERCARRGPGGPGGSIDVEGARRWPSLRHSYPRQVGGASLDWEVPTQALRRSSIVDRCGAVLLLVLVLLAVLAPVIAPYNPIVPSGQPFTPPFHAGHLLGTDEVGYDIFSRVLYGLRTSLSGVLIVVTSGVVIGGVIGLVAGAVGGWVDTVLMRFTDLFLALPGPLLAIAVVAALGPSYFHILVAVMIVWWPFYARIVRGEIRALSARPHLEAARLAGAGPARRALRHLLPGAVPAIVVTASLDVGNLVVTLAVALVPRARSAGTGARARGHVGPRACSTCSRSGGSRSCRPSPSSCWRWRPTCPATPSTT